MIIQGLDGQLLISPEVCTEAVGLIQWAQEQAASSDRLAWARSKAITALGDEIDRVGRRRLAQVRQVDAQLDGVDASMKPATVDAHNGSEALTSFRPGNTVRGLAAAAKVAGLNSKQALHQRVQNGDIEPIGRDNGTLIFYKGDLECLKERSAK